VGVVGGRGDGARVVLLKPMAVAGEANEATGSRRKGVTEEGGDAGGDAGGPLVSKPWARGRRVRCVARYDAPPRHPPSLKSLPPRRWITGAP